MPRKKQRIAAIDREFVDDASEHIPVEIIAEKSDADLFLIDNKGSKRVKVRVQKEEEKKLQLSSIERKKASRILRKKENAIAEIKPVYDIWSEEANIQSKLSKLSKYQARRPLIATVLPGTSYNPSHDDHVKAVSEAVALEQAKLTADEQNSKQVALPPTSTILPSWTNADFEVLPSDNEGEIDSDDDIEYDNDGPTRGGVLVKKRPKQITRVEHNRRKARRERELLEAQEKQRLSLLHAIDVAPLLLQSLEEQEAQRESARANLEGRKKEQALAESVPTMTYAEAGQVPLSDELHGSLRTLVPKGIPVREEARRKIQAGDMAAPNSRKRRKYEKPHAPRNVKWRSNIK